MAFLYLNFTKNISKIYQNLREKKMKKLLSYPTEALKVAMRIKDIKDSVLHPFSTIGTLIKTLIIKSLSLIIKSIIKYTIVDGKDPSSNIIMRQLNAMVDKDASLEGISKIIQFDITPDTLLERIEVDDKENGFFQSIKNKYGESKNNVRNGIYDYLSENNFENIEIIKDSINSFSNTPTEVFGLEFLNSSVEVLENNPEEKDCVLRFKIQFALKTNQ